ncbi:MAG: hypothetical protein KJ069_07520 [Anaerolineae bacterium]|nr:hypothetical protein [Anaerolineae bacterium]
MKKPSISYFIVILLTMLGVLSLCSLLFLWITSDSFFLRMTDRSSAMSVGEAFALALRDNREIKVLVAPYLWPTLDEWMEKHEVFECPRPLFSITDPTTAGVGSNIGLNKMSYNYAIDYYCPELESTYFFEIRDIVLEKINEEWQVTGWGEICEIGPDESDCTDPLNP